jgi:hypothetical protein
MVQLCHTSLFRTIELNQTCASALAPLGTPLSNMGYVFIQIIK